MRNHSLIWVVCLLFLCTINLRADVQELTIYDIQYTTDSSGISPYIHDTVITYGIVTAVFGNNFFMEERPGGPWHGIYVFRSYISDPPVRIGDSVKVESIVHEYWYLTELAPRYYGYVEVLDSNLALPGTTVVTVAEINQEQHEGMLARVDSVYFVESGTFSTEEYHIVSADGQDTAILFIKSGTDIPGNPIPTGIISVVGIISQYSHYEILPRMMSDFITTEDIPPTISEHIRLPYTPPPGVSPLVCVKIEDSDGSVVSDWLYYTTDEWATYDSITHDSVSGSYYYYTVPGLPYQGKVDYYIWAMDDEGATAVSDSFFFLQVEVPPVKINEVLYDCANDGTQGSEPYGEWIELYNAGDEEYDISGWMITDDPDFTNPSGSGDGVFTIPSGTVLGPGEFLILAFDVDTFNYYWSDHGSAQVIAYGNAEQPLYLGNSGDDIHLINPMGQEVDVMWYGSGGDHYAWGHAAADVAPGHSLMRVPDGGDTDLPDEDFVDSDYLGTPSPGTPNNPFICGDINGDGKVTAPDLQYFALYLFCDGTPPVSEWAADVNGDGSLTVSDLEYLFQYLFTDGPAPACE